MTVDNPITKRTLTLVCVEIFFALLPLVVLAAVWPSAHDDHPKTFWSGPEPSMCACILYGLTIARLAEGAILTAHRISAPNQAHNFAYSVIFLFLFPIFGIIASTVLMSKLSHYNDGHLWIASQYFNLLCSVLVFLTLGGAGMRRATEAMGR